MKKKLHPDTKPDIKLSQTASPEMFTKAKAFLSTLRKDPFLKYEDKSMLREMALSGYLERAWTLYGTLVRTREGYYAREDS